MFGFEGIKVYRISKHYYSGIRSIVSNNKWDYSIQNQILRSSLSIVLNIAEGSGRFTAPDRKHFFVMARSSLFESVAILDILKDEELISNAEFNAFYNQSEEISKMLMGMIKNLSK